MGELMAGLNEVAVANPYSWFRERRAASELVTVTPDNRMIATPYPKYLNAVMDVDMSAAVIVTDARDRQGSRPRTRLGRVPAGMGRRERGLVPVAADRGPQITGARRLLQSALSATAGISADEVERVRPLRVLPELRRGLA